MGPNGCQTRHFAPRVAAHRLAVTWQPRGWLVSLLLCTCAVAATILPNPTKPDVPWPSVSINGTASFLLADEKGGFIYVVLDSDIYKYSKTLELLTTTAASTGATVAGKDTNSSQNILTCKILLLLRTTARDLLFSCWQTKESSIKCWLNKVDDLKSGTPLLWSDQHRGLTADPGANIKGIVSSNDTNQLILTISRLNIIDEEQQSSTPRLGAISVFKITKDPKHLFMDQRSVLPYRTHLGGAYFIFDYVHILGHNEFTYFILNDIQKSNRTHPTSEDLHSVRIARICNDDPDLTSYTEISLTCHNQDNTHAKVAYLDVLKREPTLYIVFESINDNGLPSSTKRSVGKSSLCSYSMKLLDDSFNQALSACHQGRSTSYLLLKLHPGQDRPVVCQSNPSNQYEWCNSKTNQFIDGSAKIFTPREDSYMSLSGMNGVNFIYSTRQGPEEVEVYFIGTEKGLLTKLTSSEDLLFTVDLNWRNIKNYRIDEKYALDWASNKFTERPTKYAVDSDSIYVASDSGHLNQLNMTSCYYYGSCQACLNARDPLGCTWCGKTCQISSECTSEESSSLTCPPLIKSFSPKIGPLTGSTRLRLNGENFGSSRGSLSVKIGDQPCLIDHRSTNSEAIECLTPTISQPTNASITIDVADDTTSISSKGAAVSDELYSFAEVKIFGMFPSSGSSTGGSTLLVFGESLDAGANRTVLLGNTECEITEVTSKKISCRIGRIALPGSEANKSTEAQPLKVKVDGIEQQMMSRATLAGYNLSTTFTYRDEQQAADTEHTMTIDGSQATEESNHFLLIIIALFALVAVIVYLLRADIIPVCEIKLPLALDSRAPKVDDTQVTFRNPQSHKFSQSESYMAGDSMNRLVKMNGSMMSSDYFGKPDGIEQDKPLLNGFIDNEMIKILTQEKILIDRNRLTLGHVLGSGQFGRVYKGFLRVDQVGEHVTVAVKTLHNRSHWDDTLDNRAFLEEGLMMKDFEHENVLALIGVTFDANGLPMVITPFMLYGDLRSYISDEASSPTVKELINFGTQVARGMAYLSGLKFVHRDLAARNCMLDENLVVKVADFGLSRDIYERDYYSSDNKKTKLPIKWMAIESLEKCIYNTKTDVWSYGVLLWELMTRGVVPYPDVDNFDLFSYLKEGRRMLRPRYCPMILYNIMSSCWDENPANRPTFNELVDSVSNVISDLKIAKEGQQKVSRDETYCDVLK